MFVGHYAAALAAKAIEPRAPLWSYVIAAQAIDIGWGVLLMAGVEKARIVPDLPGSTLDLYHMGSEPAPLRSIWPWRRSHGDWIANGPDPAATLPSSKFGA